MGGMTDLEQIIVGATIYVTHVDTHDPRESAIPERSSLADFSLALREKTDSVGASVI